MNFIKNASSIPIARCYIRVYVTYRYLIVLNIISIILLGHTPCSPLKVSLRFGGTYLVHLQGRISQARYQPAYHLLSRWYLAWLIRLLTFQQCSWVTAVKTSNRTLPNVTSE
jgi:hypothetical protein